MKNARVASKLKVAPSEFEECSRGMKREGCSKGIRFLGSIIQIEIRL